MTILFITATRIGDAVLTTGLLDHVIATRPGARVTVACGVAAAPLFAATPGVERVIAMVKRKAALHWVDLWRACVATRWSLIVDLRGSALAHLLLAGERRVFRPTGGMLIHRVKALATVFDLDPPPTPRLWTDAAQDAAARRLIPDGAPVLAIGPTANWPGKIWDADNFIALIRRLTAAGAPLAGARVAVFGGAPERAIARPVIAAATAAGGIDLVGRVDLATAAAALRRCALYVGNDSGLMHIAAAVGTPTLGLFGPSRPERYAPWGPHTDVARTEIAYDDLFPPGYDHRATGSLMGSLGIDAVERAALGLLARTGAGTGAGAA